MENKKKSILIIILVIIILFLSGFIVYDKLINNENNASDDMSDTINNSSSTNQIESNINSDKNTGDDNFLVSYNYAYNINGENHTIAFDYFKELDSIFVVFKIDGKKIDETKTIMTYYFTYDQKLDNLDLEKVIEKNTLDHDKVINIVKGQDKEYIILSFKNGNLLPKTVNYLISSDGKFIGRLGPKNSNGATILDPTRKEFYTVDGVLYSYRITEDAFYYLDVDCGTNRASQNIATEFKVTFNDDYYNIEKSATYEGVFAGASTAC